MDSRSVRWCAHAAWPYILLLGGGVFGVAGWLPVPKPGAGAAAVAADFLDHTIAIRIGVSMLAAGTVFFWPFAVAIGAQLRRMEGPLHPLADLQRACATGTVLAGLLPAYLWLALAFRPGQVDPATFQLVNDFAWLCFIGMYAPATLQAVVIGVAILRSPRSLYPRWVAYLNLWVAVLFLPGAVVPFFKTGPFAWNGLVSFWLVATVYFGWILVMWWATLRATDVDDA